MNWKAICTTRHDRIRQDRRRDRIVEMGGWALQARRAQAIAVKMRLAEQKKAPA
jgi:hypothetical protein